MNEYKTYMDIFYDILTCKRAKMNFKMCLNVKKAIKKTMIS